MSTKKRIIQSFHEDDISLIPALQLLQSVGYVYLRPEEVFLERRGDRSNVLLEGILEKQLRRLNRIDFKGQAHEFSDGNIQQAIETLKGVPGDGLVRGNEEVYELLSLGKSLEQKLGAETRSFTLNYLDWNNPENNHFHVVEEFEVECRGSQQTCRPDIVLFVNGIPLVVIECGRPADQGDRDSIDSLSRAISRQLRNQNEAYLPGLFLYTQLLLAVNNEEAKYGTIGTRKELWSRWKEEITNELGRFLNKPLSREQKERLFSRRFAYLREYYDELELEERAANEQDRAIYCLCRPARLIELARQFIVFEAGEKKIARCHQYFAVKNTLASIKRLGAAGRRMGGLIWQTQGSGKSLAAVLLAKAIALDHSISDSRIVLLRDRIDLSDQSWGTFRSCGREPVQARTGRHLLELLARSPKAIIAAIGDKFETALKAQGQQNPGTNIFVLADEIDPDKFVDLNLKMRRVLPNACYLGFSGTPLKIKDKEAAGRFGGVIDAYPGSEAVADEAIVPLLYEERRSLLEETGEGKLYLAARDISEHFSKNWQGTPFKAQLTCDSKRSALYIKKCLDGFGQVSSEVLLSSPDVREGDDAFDVREEDLEENEGEHDEEEHDGEHDHDESEAEAEAEDKAEAEVLDVRHHHDEVQVFWKRMMEKYGSERVYQRSLINAFKNGEKPEILIVVDMLLTGFDAPRNTVLYLARNLKGHALLKAAARVNRPCAGKDFGYVIDYCGVLGEASLSEFEPAELQGIFTEIGEETAKLPLKRAELWDIFPKSDKNQIENKIDKNRIEEAIERSLADQERRAEFHARLLSFSRTMSIACSSLKFGGEGGEDPLASYKHDLAYFLGLRRSLKRRYADETDEGEGEDRVQRLMDTYLRGNEVSEMQSGPLASIFEREKFQAEVDQLLTEAARADTIAYRTKKSIGGKLDEDPIFYRRCLKSIDDAIENWREGRISEREYLNRVLALMNGVRGRTMGEIPVELQQNQLAAACYGVISEIFGRWQDRLPNPKMVSVNAALKIARFIEENMVDDWRNNQDVQNHMKNLIDDYLYSVKQIHDLDLREEDLDRILDRSIEIAKSMYSQ